MAAKLDAALLALAALRARLLQRLLRPMPAEREAQQRHIQKMRNFGLLCSADFAEAQQRVAAYFAGLDIKIGKAHP